MRLFPSLFLVSSALFAVAGEHAIDVFGLRCTDYPASVPNTTTRVFAYNLSDPTANFIALHFQNFSLPANDFVQIRSMDNPFVAPVRLYGASHRGQFKAPAVPTNAVTIELFTNSSNASMGACYGFSVNGYDSVIEGGDGNESICNIDESYEAACFNDINPLHQLMFLRSYAVTRLVIARNGVLYACTGWLVGCQGHMITNNHCINDATDASNTQVEFVAQAKACPPDVDPLPSQTCMQQLGCPGEIYGGTPKFVATDYDLDYTLVMLDPSVVTRYGSLKMRVRGPQLEEPIYTITHPRAWGKRMEYKKDGQLAIVINMTDYEAVYRLDTQKMSSGSPILSLKDHTVVALHHVGDNCPNYGVRIDLIVKNMKAQGVLPDCATVDYSSDI